jgi:hypothetical protein
MINKKLEMPMHKTIISSLLLSIALSSYAMDTNKQLAIIAETLKTVTFDSSIVKAEPLVNGHAFISYSINGDFLHTTHYDKGPHSGEYTMVIYRKAKGTVERFPQKFAALQFNYQKEYFTQQEIRTSVNWPLLYKQEIVRRKTIIHDWQQHIDAAKKNGTSVDDSVLVELERNKEMVNLLTDSVKNNKCGPQYFSTQQH